MLTEEEKSIQHIEQGKRLRDVLNMNHIPQKEIADYLDRNITTINKYERGEIPIPIDLLLYLKKYHKINIDYIVDGTAPREDIISIMTSNGEDYYNKQMKKFKKYIVGLLFSDDEE